MAKVKIYSVEDLNLPKTVPQKHKENIDKLQVNQAIKVACEDDPDCTDIDDVRRKIFGLIRRTYGEQRKFQTRLKKNNAGKKELYVLRIL